MPFIDESTKYEFVKFKDRKEVFAMVSESNGDLELHFPMNLEHCFDHVLFGFQIPVQTLIPQV